MLDDSIHETSNLNNSSLTGDADSVISRRLVTFRDVRELQQRNAELLAVIREMSANQVKKDWKKFFKINVQWGSEYRQPFEFQTGFYTPYCLLQAAVWREKNWPVAGS